MNSSGSKNFQNKKIAILGFGLEGKSVLSFLHAQKAVITVIDERSRDNFEEREVSEFEEKGVQCQFGEKIGDLIDFDMVVRSPGVPVMRDELQEAKKANVEVTSPTKLFFDLSPTKQLIGVTGTKGKGTTSTLIYNMLKKAGFDAYLGGNIGEPPLNFIGKLTSDSWVVLELSSFQLQDLHKSPHIAVMLMVTSEHLDYHKDVYEYVEAKRNILKYQEPEDFAVLNRDYPATLESDIHTDGNVFQVSRVQEVDKGAFVRENALYLRENGTETEIIKTEDLKLPGKHNWENVMAAAVAATLAGAEKKDMVSVLKSFEGLPHRLELVKTVKGVKYYNDSFSTTPETAIAAIEAFDEPKVLILGGSSKGSDFTNLGQLLSEDDSLRAIIGIGEEWNTIKLKVKSDKLKVIEGLKSMPEIVAEASRIAKLGDIVLLSPACASFGMFKNYKDRGEQFRKAVEDLIH